MDSSVSPKDEIWFLRVCHHISNTVYKRFEKLCWIRRQGRSWRQQVLPKRRCAFYNTRRHHFQEEPFQSRPWEPDMLCGFKIVCVYCSSARFEVLTAAFRKTQVLGNVTPCRVVNSYRRFEWSSSLSPLGLLDAEDQGSTILPNVIFWKTWIFRFWKRDFPCKTRCICFPSL